MIFLELLLGFLKVGCLSFGGAYAAIPLIRDVVLAYGWLDEEMLTYMIGVSESTPGPIMVNIATYVGFSKGGILGAIIATIAVVLPAFLIVLVITKILSKAMTNKYFQAFLGGIRPSIIGIILATGGWMIFSNILGSKAETGVNIISLIITVILALICFVPQYVFKKKISPIMIILISAFLGIIGFGINV